MIVSARAEPRGAIGGRRGSPAECEPGTLVVSATKGIETDTLALMSQVFDECLPRGAVRGAVGPQLRRWRSVRASRPRWWPPRTDEATARDAQRIFATPRFRVYSHDDVVGVELAGALKNVIAIAAGILEGLGLGHNPRAALITRGLAEITRLGVALGADPLTFAGLAGMGDLILTTTGSLSRNRALGVALAQGADAGASTGQRTAAWPKEPTPRRRGAALGARMGVELPITEKVCEVLFQGKPPREAVAELMARELKSEQWR